VIDWTNARAGDPRVDDALTWLILTTSGGLAGKALAQLFGRRLDIRTGLEDAAAYRLADPNVTDAERARVRAVAGHELLERSQVVPRPLEEAFAFFADPWNLEAITPPWLRFRIVDAPHALAQGSVLRYRLRLFGLPVSWRTVIAVWEPPHRFVDVQSDGPYRLWEHTHELEEIGAGRTLIRDRVRYRVPAPELAARPVRRALESIFDFRADALRRRLG
jgi:ligand-binding SRPBCC domain-containing protein